MPCLALGATLEPRELARLHDPRRGLDEQEADDALQPRWAKCPVAADHQPGTVARQLVQQEGPERIGIEAREGFLWVESPAAQVNRHPQTEETLRLEGGDRPPC